MATSSCSIRRRQSFDGRWCGSLAQPDRAQVVSSRLTDFVRQLAAGDVAVGQLDGINHRLVQNREPGDVAPASRPIPASSRWLVLVGLFDFDDLKPTGQGRVLFEVFLVLGPGRGGDGAKFAAGQGRFEQVGRVALPGLRRRLRSWCGLRQ